MRHKNEIGELFWSCNAIVVNYIKNVLWVC